MVKRIAAVQQESQAGKMVRIDQVDQTDSILHGLVKW